MRNCAELQKLVEQRRDVRTAAVEKPRGRCRNFVMSSFFQPRPFMNFKLQMRAKMNSKRALTLAENSNQFVAVFVQDGASISFCSLAFSSE